MRRLLMLLAAFIAATLSSTFLASPAFAAPDPWAVSSSQAAENSRNDVYGHWTAAGRGFFDKTFKNPSTAKKIMTDKVEADLIRINLRQAKRAGKTPGPSFRAEALAAGTYREQARAKVERLDDARTCSISASRDYYLQRPALLPCNTPFDGRLTDDEARNIDTLFCTGEILLTIGGGIWGKAFTKGAAILTGFDGAKCFWDNLKPSN